jgi:hypothetical protein
LSPAAISCSPDPRLATEAPPLSSPQDLFDKPTLFLPSSLHPALIAPPLIQHHDLLYFLPRHQSVNAIRHRSSRLIFPPSCFFIKALDLFDTGIFEFSSFRIRPPSEK